MQIWLSSLEYIRTSSKANLTDLPENLQGNSCSSPMVTVTPADVKLEHLKLSMPLVLLPKTTSEAVSMQTRKIHSSVTFLKGLFFSMY